MIELVRARILIIDLRSQLTYNIERVNRELGYRSAVLPPKKAKEWLVAGYRTDAIILSGGDQSAYDDDAPAPPDEIFTARRADGSKIPILGICYGHQWLAHKLGGSVAAVHAEHGHAVMRVTSDCSVLFKGLPDLQAVWMNHGDSVTRMPPGFRLTAVSQDTNADAAMENVEESMFSLQAHPEATHSECGPRILDNFLRFAGCKKDWQPSSLIDTTRAVLADQIAGGKLLLPYSGGVDSSVAGAIAGPVFGERLQGVTIDGGQLRHNELDEVRSHAELIKLQHYVIDMRSALRFFQWVTHSEAKRKLVFQPHFYERPLRGAIRKFNATHVMQGTLAPDIIESGGTGGDVIKTHHNFGNDLGVPEVIPLSNLFKYEVRALARTLGLPESISERKPFPGPGLFIRVVGKPVTAELLTCVRWADHLVECIVRKDDEFWRNEISQLVVAYLGVDVVGQKGDKRAYAGNIGIRAVKTVDFMTAEGVELPTSMRREIKRVLPANPLVARVNFDETDKPPGATEYE